jgi:hypothetical protein
MCLAKQLRVINKKDVLRKIYKTQSKYFEMIFDTTHYVQFYSDGQQSTTLEMTPKMQCHQFMALTI